MEGLRPTGTVAFLFSDVEGSTRLWEKAARQAPDLFARHDELVRRAITSHGGWVFSTAGDSFAAAFPTVIDAVDAAVEAQRALAAERWPVGAALRVRMGVHVGAAHERDGDYFGPAVNRASRLADAGHGGQILVSAAAERMLPPPPHAGWLVAELGEFRLKDLAAAERISEIRVEGLPSTFPPLRTLHAHAHNLPFQLTSFVGRDEAVAAVTAELAASRLVTLTGPGGCGKTRLALHSAAAAADRFDSVHLTELAPITDPALVAARMVESLGHVATGLSRLEVDEGLLSRVGSRRALVVLDNCEHVLEECARVAHLLVRRCPNVVILATSRQALGVPGEHLRPVAPLDLPPVDAAAADVMASAAGALFAERAHAVRPSFELTAGNAAAVAAICRHVDGLPLAVELAAARLRAMSPAAIAERLGRSARVLGDGSRTGDPRHRTLEACLRWSFDMLDADESAVLRRLSVFAGGAALDAIDAVCAAGDLTADDVEDVVVRLVDKSLVIPSDEGDELRYRLHELVRQFADARLQEAGEATEVCYRHLRWCADLVRRWSPGMRSLTTLESVEPLLPEVDNLAAAVEFGLSQRDSLAVVRLLGGGGEMWAHVGRMRQLAAWWDRALPLLPTEPTVEFPPNRLGLAQTSAAATLLNVGRYAEAHELCARVQSIPGASPDTAAFAHWCDLCRLGGAGAPISEVTDALVRLIDRSADRLLVEESSRTLGGLYLILAGRPTEAQVVLGPVLERDDGAGIMGPTARAAMGVALVLEGRQDAGLRLLAAVRSEAQCRTTHWRYVVYWLEALGHLAAGTTGEPAVGAMVRALQECHASGMYWTITWAVETAALFCGRRGERRLAAAVLAGIDADLARHGGRPVSAQPGTILEPLRSALFISSEPEGPVVVPLAQDRAVRELLRSFEAR